GTGLDRRPREDGQRDDVHARLAHQPDVLVPHLGRPLLGVVVGAVPERARVSVRMRRPAEGPFVGSAAAHLIAPVMPAANDRCSTRKMTIVGSEARSTASISTP